MPCLKNFSRIDSTGRAHAGSQRQIQMCVNESTHALNSAVAQSLSRYKLDQSAIRWVAPLAADTYSEYQDSEFLERVGSLDLGGWNTLSGWPTDSAGRWFGCRTLWY
jgi:hypothetical protein